MCACVGPGTRDWACGSSTSYTNVSALALLLCSLLRWQALSAERLWRFLTCTAPASSMSVALGRAGAAGAKEEGTAQPYTF